MKKYVVGIILFILLLSVSIIITIVNKKSIVGIWKSVGKNKDYYYIFNKNKTCSYEMIVARLDCTYEIDDNKISVLYKGNTKTNTFKYQIEGNTLVIKGENGKENKFVKVK